MGESSTKTRAYDEKSQHKIFHRMLYTQVIPPSMKSVRGPHHTRTANGLVGVLSLLTIGYIVGRNQHEALWREQQTSRLTTGLIDAREYSPLPPQGQAAKVRSSKVSQNAHQSIEEIHTCKNAIVFTAPRHGSTWFINNINHCKFAANENQRQNGHEFTGQVFQRTELWHKFGFNMTADDALQFIETEHSVKIFVGAAARPEIEKRVWELVRKHHSRKYPVILLRRNALDVFKSLQTAKGTMQWKSHGVETLKEVTELPILRLDEYADKLNKDFANVEDRLKSMGIPYSVLHYEDMLGKSATVAHEVGCKIEVCSASSES